MTEPNRTRLPPFQFLRYSVSPKTFGNTLCSSAPPAGRWTGSQQYCAELAPGESSPFSWRFPAWSTVAHDSIWPCGRAKNLTPSPLGECHSTSSVSGQQHHLGASIRSLTCKFLFDCSVWNPSRPSRVATSILSWFIARMALDNNWSVISPSRC